MTAQTLTPTDDELLTLLRAHAAAVRAGEAARERLAELVRMARLRPQPITYPRLEEATGMVRSTLDSMVKERRRNRRWTRT
jgi:hypothetical protein